MYSGELTRTPPEKRASRHIGLIVGMNRYQDSTFQPLQFAENDARALAQWLVNNKGGKWSPPDVQLVQGQHATRELIESLITQICLHKAEEGDSILLYFAGHAFIDERSGEGYLALTNSRYQDPSTCLSLHAFSQHVLTQSRATQILCIFDCFQTGPIWSMHRMSSFDSRPLLSSSVLSILQSYPNRLFMCSCRGNEQAPESGTRGLSPFIHQMILGLCGPAVDQATGGVTLSRLHAYLFGALGEQQRPQLFGQQEVPFSIVGDIPEVTSTRQATAANFAAGFLPGTESPSSSTHLKKSGFMGAASSTATAPPVQAVSPSTSGHFLSSALDQQREQQGQQMVAQAQQLFQAQNYGEAFNLVEQVLQNMPNNLPALILKGQLLGTAGRYTEAQQVIEHILQLDPNNAMGWSMQAVVSSNLGQHQQALTAVERSLELDAQNPETYAIKNNIMSNLAVAQTQTPEQSKSKLRSDPEPRKASQGFILGLALSILGIVAGLIGFGLMTFIASIPYIGLFVICISIGILCVNAARGAFHYGLVLLVETILVSVVLAGILGAMYKVGQASLIHQINLHPSLFMPVLVLVAWLIVSAAVPPVLALGGFVGGFPSRRRQKHA
ncbi:tetratricopeptide repeat protein [Dictyobacter halimunensis]